jgi:ADP-ribose pyrophosphatase YjhB (NUDIX family)
VGFDAEFCIRCGTPLRPDLRGGRSRPVCPDCGWVHWHNPKAAVAVILREGDGRILLARRSGSDRPGAWCIPCGNIEYEEDVREAAVREFHEETGLRVTLGPVYAVLSNVHDPQAHSVGIWFLGRRDGGEPVPGGDVDALAWHPPGAPPRPLAFATDRIVLAALAAGRPYVDPTGTGRGSRR